MKIELMVDPPNGWLYGFPKAIPNERLNDVINWMIENGYPKKLIDSFGDEFTFRIFEIDVI